MGEKERKERFLLEKLYTVHDSLKLKVFHLIILEFNHKEMEWNLSDNIS